MKRVVLSSFAAVLLLGGGAVASANWYEHYDSWA
jgi:hypothetical protein